MGVCRLFLNVGIVFPNQPIYTLSRLICRSQYYVGGHLTTRLEPIAPRVSTSFQFLSFLP